MRALAYAAIFGVVVLAAAAAAADPWADPAGRFTLTVPHGWRVQVIPQANVSWVKIGNAERECQFLAEPNTQTATVSAAAVHTALQDQTKFGQDAWLRMANSISAIFPNNTAQFVSSSHDDAGYWPIQRAEFASPGHIGDPPLPVSAVHAGYTLRPGVDIWGYCYTVSDPDYPTADNPAIFDPILRSMGTSNDAALQAAAQAAAAAAAAAPPPPPPPPPAAGHPPQQRGQHLPQPQGPQPSGMR
jgi:hypothetical protein